MKATIIMSNEERKKIQIVNNIKDPSDLKAYFACFLECDPQDIKIRMEELIPKELNICGTQDIVRLVISAGDKGISIQEIKDTTFMCGESWDTERPDFLFDQFEQLIRKGDITKKNNHYVLSEDYHRQLNEPIIIKELTTKGFCIYCKNHIMITDNPKEGECKAKKGYTTQNALRKLACTDYDEMPDECKSCRMRGLCPHDYNSYRFCWSYGQDWKQEEYKLLKKQTGEKGRVIKEFDKIKGVKNDD